MRKITKTFYVDQEFFQALMDNNCFFEIPNAVFDINSISGGRKKIEISYEEPEKKIEITENDFDEAFRDAFKLRGYSKDFFIELKKRLFNQQ